MGSVTSRRSCATSPWTSSRRWTPPPPPPPSRSRLSLPLRGNTPCGSVAPSWPPSPPSSRCGSPSRSTTSPAPALSTGSASKLTHNNSYCHHSDSHNKSSQEKTSSHQQQQQQDTTARPWRKRAWRDSYENSTIFLTKCTQWCFPFVIY